jgi:FkbM family methyltransferase
VSGEQQSDSRQVAYMRKLVRFIYDHRAIPKRIISILAPKPVLLNLGLFKMYVRLDDWAVGARIAVKRTYERHVTRVIRSSLKPGAVVIDIGANIGYYTLMSAACVGARGKVIAFEPSSDNCALLKMSLRKNNFDNVLIHSKAVADKNGLASFSMDDSNGTISQNREMAHSVLVATVALDTYLQDEPRIDLIKIDIEGAEGLALNGMKRILRQHRPIILTEFNPNALRKTSDMSPEDFLDQLRTLDYALYVIHNSDSTYEAPQSNQEIMARYAEQKSDHLDIQAVPEELA